MQRRRLCEDRGRQKWRCHRPQKASSLQRLKDTRKACPLEPQRQHGPTNTFSSDLVSGMVREWIFVVVSQVSSPSRVIQTSSAFCDSILCALPLARMRFNLWALSLLTKGCFFTNPCWFPDSICRSSVIMSTPHLVPFASVSLLPERDGWMPHVLSFFPC